MEEVASDTPQGRVGSVLRGKWLLGPIIGSGGTAMVYEGTHRSNGKRVAVKVLHRTLASIDDTVARFRREGFVANLVNHPGTVAIFDDDTTEDGVPYIVMDRLDGEPLTKVLERAGIDGVGGSLEPARVLAIADDVLGVLAAAHAKGIIHRDVKPDNVFITRAGRAMLLDFGIARVEGDAARLDPTRGLTSTSGLHRPPEEERDDRVMTLDGSTLGTPKYMAPEQARGRWSEVDGRSDLWALGATMFRALAGCGVRSAPTTSDLLLMAMTERAPRLREVAPNVAPEIAAIVDRALALEKKDRWSDALAMREAIREAAPRAGDAHDASRESPTLTPTQSPSLPLRPPSRAAPAAWLALGTLVFVGFAAAIAWRPLASPSAVEARPRSKAAATVAPSAPEAHDAVDTSEPTPPPAPSGDVIPTVDVNALPVPAPTHHRRPRPRPAASGESGAPAQPEVTPSPSPLERRH